MPSQTVASRIRLGILALPMSATLFLVANIIIGPGPDSPDDIRAYAEFAASTRYAVSGFLIAVGALLAIFGFVALYAFMASGRAERWAFFAMVLCVPGAAAAFAVTAGASGVETVAAEQYLEGQRAVLEEWSDRFDWSSIFFIVAYGAGFGIGLILFGVAIWRSRTLPQGAAILWLASSLLVFASPLTWWAVPISFLLLIVANGWINWVVWRQPLTQVGEAETQQRVR